MDSKSLLVKQYQTHAELLCELLATPAGEPAAAGLLARSRRGTHLLAGSTSLMGVSRWSDLCGAFEQLLGRFADRSLHWDERIADVTSELIDKAETLVAAWNADNAIDLNGVVGEEELAALIAELQVLDEEYASQPVPATLPEPATTGEDAPVEPVADAGPPPAVSATITPAPSTPQPPPVEANGAEGPLPGVMAELRESFRRLEEGLASPEWTSRAWDSPQVDAIRRELNTIDFCARSIEKVIGDKADGSATQRRSSLSPLRVALRDFSAELAHGTGREFSVELSGDDLSIDPRLLSTTVLVLQSMITDTFSRAGGDVHIDIRAHDSNGALRWTLRDDGGNFNSDSPLDHEDQLAFYPGLRGVINMIARHRGVLWVEPRSTGDGPMRRRFEFTMPVTDTGDSLMLWNGGAQSFALRATQVCAILDAAGAGANTDAYGEHIVFDGARVPLFQLDELYRNAPGRGDAVAVLGALEKRVAFHVPGNGQRVEAHVLSGAVPPWEGAPPYVAQVDQRRVPLLDADYVISGYHSVTGTMSTEAISGGVPDDEPDVNPRQDDPAPPVSERPPEAGDGGTGIDVLVVEQSETMRESLTGILSGLKLAAECAADVDEALDIVGSRAPRLVISEFRMPTMAAKRIVDRLGQRGSDIPVLVTTSQTGVTAELLVEKLGASGYLSKPIDASEVSARVTAHLGEGVGR